MGSVLFSGARASYLSVNLLGDERLKRALDGDFDNAVKVLSETGFGVGVSADADIDALIEKETEKLAEFIRSAAPTADIKKYFLLPYDFRNAESVIKAKYLKTEPILNRCGVLDEKTLKDKIFADDYKGLPDNMAKALSEADRIFVEGTADGCKINSLFIKALYDELFALKTDKRISEMLKAQADMLNIGIALRARNYDMAKRQFVKCGILSENDLKTLCEAELAVISEKFFFSRYKAEMTAAINGLENDKNLKEFEKASESYPAKMMNKERYSSEGAVPFIRYCVYKKADIVNARIILIGLSVGLSREGIASRLRAHYER